MKTLAVIAISLALSSCVATWPAPLNSSPERILALLETQAETMRWCSPCNFPVVISSSPVVEAEIDRATWTILITRGLLDFIKNDDELAFVLAHESAHRLSILGMPAHGLEMQADRLGIILMRDAGFDPWKGLDILRRLAVFFPTRDSYQGYPTMPERIRAIENFLERE